jgi:hypothetical protein
MTLTVVGWLDVFTRPLYVNEIIKSLQFCQEKKGLEIYAYVIMRNAAQTNHIHLVAARTEGEMSDVLRDFNRTGAPEFYSQAIIEFDIRKPKRITQRMDGDGFQISWQSLGSCRVTVMIKPSGILFYFFNPIANNLQSFFGRCISFLTVFRYSTRFGFLKKMIQFRHPNYFILLVLSNF